MDITIFPNGVVECVRKDKDGVARRTMIETGDMDTARKLLDKRELAEVIEAWTPRKIKARQAELAAIEKRLREG